MCFYHDDYDWCAEIEIVRDWPFGPRKRCCECGSDIDYGDWRRSIFQQESENCEACQLYPGESPPDDDEEFEPCETCDFGYSFHGTICLNCVKVLKAIEAVEIDAGCPAGARQPAIGELSEALNEHNDGDKYVKRAMAMYPELGEYHNIATLNF